MSTSKSEIIVCYQTAPRVPSARKISPQLSAPHFLYAEHTARSDLSFYTQIIPPWSKTAQARHTDNECKDVAREGKSRKSYRNHRTVSNILGCPTQRDENLCGRGRLSFRNNFSPQNYNLGPPTSALQDPRRVQTASWIRRNLKEALYGSPWLSKLALNAEVSLRDRRLLSTLCAKATQGSQSRLRPYLGRHSCKCIFSPL